MALPASSSYPTAQRISPGGTPYYTSFVLVDTVTGRPFTVAVTNGVLTLTPVPTVADIRADFDGVASMRANVATVAALRTWGF